MNTLEVIDYLKTYNKFIGVYPRDKLPFTLNKGCGIIINTDKASGPGEHWTAIYLNQNSDAIYFDSFGLPPLHTEIIKFLDKVSPRGWSYNQITFQNIMENTCGLYCVYFLANMFNNQDFNNFVSVFSFEKNDLFAKILYKAQNM